MDCGVAPGMGNIIFSNHDKTMKITDYECLVGGLPKKREWPFEYKAVFSPIDVIEEYVRPARYCLLYTSPSPRDVEESRMPSSA